MCGIVGSFDLGTTQCPPPEAAVRAAAARMTRRGPDEEGFHFEPGLGLGHRRLSVIDLKTGSQPFKDDASGSILVFNGEIFNFRELRRDLESRGHSFRTTSDTEVLLKSYVEWGVECLPKLVGMYAFAIFDPRLRRMFIARDRIGVKPLFYAVRQDRLLFASSMPALLALPGVEPTLDLPAVSHYLTTIRTTLGRRSMIRDVFALQPGEYLLGGGGRIEVRRYWDYPIAAPGDKADPGADAAIGRLRELMTESVAGQLISDVPLGGFLSGGIDSSILASLACTLSNGNFNAYSVGYDIEGYNEWPFVRMAAEHCRMRCEEIHLNPAHYPRDWKMLIEEKGLPLSTPNEVPIYHLASALKRDFTVALSGEGADEVFCGYTIPYVSAYDFDRARRTAPGPDEMLSREDRAIRRLYRRPYIVDNLDHHFLLNSWIPAGQKAALLSPEAAVALEGDGTMISEYSAMFDRLSCCSTLDKHLHIHARVNLEGLLFRVDSSTMAASVEARVPFTDHRIVEFLFGLPDHYKMQWRSQYAAEQARMMNAAEIDRKDLVETKVLLRRAFADAVPTEILARRKMSFPVPVREWFAGFLGETASDALAGSPLLGALFNPSEIAALLKQPSAPAAGMALWPVVNLCLWQKAVGAKV